MALDAALIASAALLGLAGAPHCAAMCAAPCTAVVGRDGAAAQAVFHGARIASYALAGAVVASSAGALSALAQASPALRPLWVLVQAAALALGLWLLWQGRQPAWMGAVGRRAVPGLPAGATTVGAISASPLSASATTSGTGAAVIRLHRQPGAVWRSAAAGGLWVAWPCGLLHSALLVAAMSNTAAAGAAAMAAFAALSAAGLVWGPWLWRRLGTRAEPWAARLAGLALAAAAGWALLHGVWHDIAVYCGWA